MRVDVSTSLARFLTHTKSYGSVDGRFHFQARPDAGTVSNNKKEQYPREPPSSLSTSPSSSAGSTNNGSTYPGANFPRSLSRCRRCVCGSGDW